MATARPGLPQAAARRPADQRIDQNGPFARTVVAGGTVYIAGHCRAWSDRLSPRRPVKPRSYRIPPSDRWQSDEVTCEMADDDIFIDEVNNGLDEKL